MVLSKTKILLKKKAGIENAGRFLLCIGSNVQHEKTPINATYQPFACVTTNSPEKVIIATNNNKSHAFY